MTIESTEYPNLPTPSALAAEQGYSALSDMPTDVLQRNLRWAERMEKAWGKGKATKRLRECVRDWQQELERRTPHNAGR